MFAGLGLHLAQALLAPATACPGLPERLAIAGTRLGPAAPLGAWMIWANRILLIAAAAMFARVAYSATGMWTVAAAAALALAAHPLFAIAMSAFDPLIALVACLTLCSILSPGSNVRTWLCLLCTAAIVPQVALPMAAIAGGYALATSRSTRLAHRLGAAALASIALAGGVAALVATTPGLPPSAAAIARASCLLPAGSGHWLPQSFDALSEVISAAGPFVCALAALGAFTYRARWLDARVWLAIAYAAAPLAIGASMAAHNRVFAPAMVTMWLVAACGLAEVVRACGDALRGRAAAIAMVLLLPLLQVAKWNHDVTSQALPRATAMGHDTMTLDGLRRAFQEMPDGSTVIAEDATTDLLLRALDGTWQRSGKTLRISRASQEEVSAAVQAPSAHVFALPLAQRTLPYLGFRLIDDELAGVSGFSEVRAGGACRAATEAWQPVNMAPPTLLVVVARSTHDEGAAAVYVGSGHPLAPRPVDWPAWTTRGFITSFYDAAQRDELDRQALSDGLAPTEAALGKPYVARLELWKGAEAPVLMPVDLGAADSPLVTAHVTPGFSAEICPGFPHRVQAVSLPK